ncbi:MAG: ATP-binding protein [Candidatus Gastranaerophilales bacterium]|nr:ATP-binding protein [Candidatus Gastranaerophilales bacterium]
MNVVMLLTVLSLSSYYMSVSQKLSQISLTEKKFTNSAISNIIFSATKESINRNNFEILEEISNKLKNNTLVSFVVVYKSPDSYKITWSDLPDLEGKAYTIEEITKIYQDKYPFATKLSFTESEVNGKKVVVAYTIETGITYAIDDLVKTNSAIVLGFVLLSSFIAILMFKIVISPINELTKGVHVLAKGNLKHKIPYTPYGELNILVSAFNDMASMIDRIHTSLEDRIRERTEEISQKNKELKSAYKELQEAQAMVVHSEKMRSLGELVAGITHEINNPINFIYGNLMHLSNYSQDLIDIIEKFKLCEPELSEGQRNEIKKLLEEKEYSYIKEDLPDLIKSCREGTIRTKNIVSDLKNFSRAEEMIINEIDINKELNTTLNILYNKYKTRIRVHKEYSDLPKIDCFGGQINQVFVNLIDNAIGSIKNEGDIFIRTKFENNNIIVEVEDTGVGIPKENLKKVFEPFFTTKSVGEGTGLGMSITYKIVETHNGKIDIESEVNKGSKFTVTLPLDGIKRKAKNEV